MMEQLVTPAAVAPIHYSLSAALNEVQQAVHCPDTVFYLGIEKMVIVYLPSGLSEEPLFMEDIEQQAQANNTFFLPVNRIAVGQQYQSQLACFEASIHCQVYFNDQDLRVPNDQILINQPPQSEQLQTNIPLKIPNDSIYAITAKVAGEPEQLIYRGF